ncbi:unnamed protein product [Pedinophyceae sp. YPF-701]|nr:unnamed protein product [Pedinophyceae sp. YPF-701]
MGVAGQVTAAAASRACVRAAQSTGRRIGARRASVGRGKYVCAASGGKDGTDRFTDVVLEKKRQEMAEKRASEESVSFEEALRMKKGQARARKRKAQVNVNAPEVDKAYKTAPEDRPIESQAEAAYLQFLTAYFVGILAMGVFLGGSGFLSDEADRIAQDFVYPAFSPVVGGFLFFSSLYGIYKAYGPGRAP